MRDSPEEGIRRSLQKHMQGVGCQFFPDDVTGRIQDSAELICVFERRQGAENEAHQTASQHCLCLHSLCYHALVLNALGSSTNRA